MKVSKKHGCISFFHYPSQAYNTPYYNDTHKQFRKLMREYVDEHIMSNVHDWDEKGTIPKERTGTRAPLGSWVEEGVIFLAAGPDGVREEGVSE